MKTPRLATISILTALALFACAWVLAPTPEQIQQAQQFNPQQQPQPDVGVPAPPGGSTNIVTNACWPYPIITVTGLKCPSDGATNHGTNHDPMVWYSGTVSNGIAGAWFKWESPHLLLPGQYFTAYFHHACTNHTSSWAAFVMTCITSNSTGLATNYFTGIMPQGARLISGAVGHLSSTATPDLEETNLCISVSNTDPTNNPVSTGTNSLSPVYPGCSCVILTNVSSLTGQNLTNYFYVCTGSPQASTNTAVTTTMSNPPWEPSQSDLMKTNILNAYGNPPPPTHPEVADPWPAPPGGVSVTPSPVAVPNWVAAGITVRSSEPGYVTEQVIASSGTNWQELDGTNAYALQYWADLSHSTNMAPTNQLYVPEDAASVDFWHVVTSNYWSNYVAPLGTNWRPQFYFRTKYWGTNFPTTPTNTFSY